LLDIFCIFSEAIEALSVKREEDMQEIREEMEKEVCDMKQKLEEEVENKKKARRDLSSIYCSFFCILITLLLY
jgi:F0F1-type ATP synthase membrane subunit b/b'